jgi:UDP-2-acetamido-3-amino-2,3-dideoxy-glucuronate N-acetyltransferase
VAQHNQELESFIQARLTDHLSVLRELSAAGPALARLAQVVTGALLRGRKLLLFGNGGSAADCQHLAAELVNRFVLERPGYAALALTTDTSALTSIANDYAYEEIFSRQVQALGQEGDVALGISTSGNSPNVLRGLAVAREKGLVTVGFTGADGGKMAGQVDHLLAVPSKNTARIQEGHIFLGHVLCELVEQGLAERGGYAGASGAASEGGTGAKDASSSSAAVAPSYFVHPSSYVDEGAEIGAGTKIWFFNHVQKGAHLGRDCIVGQNVNIDRDAFVGDRVKIQNNVSVYKGVIVEDDAFLGPSMVFTNVINPRSHVNRKNEFLETRVGKGATIGANATVVCGHNVGAYAFVAAGSVVTKDVPAYALVMGNPARGKGWVCQCGTKLEFSSGSVADAACRACGARYQKIGEQVTVVETL